MSTFPDYTKCDGLELAERVRRGEVHPTELVETAIARIEALNPRLNAVIHKLYDDARQSAARSQPHTQGAFAGVPFLLKDLLAEYGGAPLCSGSRFHRGNVSAADGELVVRYKQAGLITLGKTNTPEYGIVPYTEPEAFGPSHNPWKPGHTTGGSSGGSGAAVAARMVPLAHGGDGGGSIRIPASCNGVFGLKPTQGRTPAFSEFHGWGNCVVEHVLTISVRDSAAALDATHGPRPGGVPRVPPPERSFLEEVGRPPGRLRIAFSDKPILGNQVHPACSEGLARTVELLTDLGHELMEDAPTIDRLAFSKAFVTMLAGEIRADVRQAEQRFGRKASSANHERDTWILALMGEAIRAADYVASTRQLERSAHQVRSFMAAYDLFLTPTLAKPPVRLGQQTLSGARAATVGLLARANAAALLKAAGAIDSAAETVFEFVPYTPLFNVSGQPAMSVPLHWTETGLPVGMHFAAHFGEEATLFRLAGQLEQARPWRDKLPPVS